MTEPFQQRLENCRQGTLNRVLQRLDEQANVDPVNHSNAPETAGVYVFYAKSTGVPVYVGETDDLKRRLTQHCRLKGGELPSRNSVFQRRWVRHWIGIEASNQEVYAFIRSMTGFKYLVLPFGRLELEEDLKARWRLHGPESVSAQVFNS